MDILKKYGFDRQKLENIQEECKGTLAVISEAFKKLNIQPDEQFKDLCENFESRIEKRFANVADAYTRLTTGSEAKSQLPLNAVGNCMLAAMAYETGYTLNHQSIFRETDTARFGTRHGVRLDGEKGLEQMLDDCLDDSDFVISVINPKFLYLYSEDAVEQTTNTVEKELAAATAKAICFHDDIEDDANAVSAYEAAILDAFSAGDVSHQQALNAVSRFYTLQAPQSLEEIAAVIDDRFKELQDKKSPEME